MCNVSARDNLSQSNIQACAAANVCHGLALETRARAGGSPWQSRGVGTVGKSMLNPP